MGETAAETLTEIEQTRARLERDIDDLFGRLPEPAVLAKQARTYGAVAAGSAAVIGLTAVRARQRSADKARRQLARVNAEELARAFSPNAPTAADDGGRSATGALALVVAVVAVVLTVLNGRRAG